MKGKSIWYLFASEFIGTALLLGIGLSFVILDWGEGSAVAHLIPSAGARRLLTGFLFGSTGCLITLSPVGKISGAHINPAMSFAFWLRGKMKTGALVGYIISQMLGAAVGSLPLLLWKSQGKSVQYGITLPGNAGITAAFVGELITTATLVVVVFVFVGSKTLRNYTAFTMPPLYCFMVWAEATYSGCSTNPARSFGPALLANNFHHYWIFVVAPLLASFVVSIVFRLLRLHRLFHLKSARISYHDSPTHESITTGDVMAG
ncbi:MAG: aquaporin [Bacteroidota bacterium]|nr:aquaporin [Bacteroidota bacterium]